MMQLPGLLEKNADAEVPPRGSVLPARPTLPCATALLLTSVHAITFHPTAPSCQLAHVAGILCALMSKHCPSRTRRLVGLRDHCDLRRPAMRQLDQPGRRGFVARRDRTRALDQQCAHIGIIPLVDAQQVNTIASDLPHLPHHG